MGLIRNPSVLVLAALTAPLVLGQAHGCHLKDATIDELKSIYLLCDRAVMRGQLNTAGIMQCSVVYEELKWRAFDGDFEKLLTWSRSQPTERSRGR